MVTSGLVTVAFTDLVASTELAEASGADVADRIRREHLEALRQAVTGTGGVPVKTIGDSLMASWTSAADALDGAIAMQQAVARRNRDGSGPRLSMRIGISAGDATFEDDDWFGRPVVEASRLCGEAEGGQILAADLVRVLAGNRGHYEVRPAGERALKGLAEPVSVCEVLWAEAGATGTLPLPAVAGRVLASGLGFVGRDDQMAEVETVRKQAIAGGRRLVLISGEPGIGKSRLAAEVAATAHDEGAFVLWGGCDEDLGIPYQPFAEAIGELVHQGAERERLRRLGLLGAQLGRLVPDLDRLVPGLPELPRADAEADRQLLFDAVGELLADVAEDAPVVLVVDDLHWAAKPTLLLLRHLLRLPRPTRLLVVGTYRDTDLDRRHPLAEMLADLRREEDGVRVALGGLSSEGVEELMVSAAGHELPERGVDLAALVHRETEGNPFFVREVLLHLVESGALVQREGRWVSDVQPEQMGIPEGVREVIGRRLSRLPEAANEVLATASVLGRRFDLALLAAVCGDPFDIVLEHLEAAERANLVRPSSASGSYSFAHALVRSTLYDELPTSRRLRLHRDAGLALEGFGAVDDHLADLARHFGEAAALGEARRAVDYGLRAGDRASADLAFEEAMSHYERALLALELPGEVGPDDRRRLLLALGTAQSHAGDPSHVATLYEAADLARDAGDATDLAEAAIAIGYHRFARAAVGSQDPQLLALLEEALDGIAPEDMAIRSRLHAQIAAVLMFGEGTERRRWHESDESLRLARAVGDPGLLSDILGFRIAVYDSGNADAVGRYREELTERVALAEAINDYQLLLALLARSPIPVLGGNRAATEADLDRARELAPRLRVAALEHRLAVLDSAMLLLDGRLEEAEAAMMAWVAFADRHGLSWTDAIGGQYYRLRYEQGRLDELIPTLLERVEVAPTVAGWRVAAAGAYAQIGQPDEAREHLRVLAADQFAVVGHDINWLMVMAGTARSAAMVGEDDIAAQAYELALPFRGELAWTGVTFEQPVDLSLGTAAARLGRFDVAEDHFRASLELSERVRAPTFVAVTRLHWAQALADRDGAGDGTRSRELAAMALATAEELGLGRILRVARDLLA